MSSHLPASIQSLLRGLKYPRFNSSLDLAQPDQLQSLVDWLENAVIRLYAAGGSERQSLKSPDPAVFHTALLEYLAELGCPYDWANGENLHPVVHWMLGHAAALMFEDNKEQYKAILQRAVQSTKPAQECTRRDLPPLPDIDSAEAQKAMRSWLQVLRIEAAGEVTPELLHRARDRLELEVLPALRWQDEHPGVPLTLASLLEDVQLGFTTGNPEVDLAAKVKRLVYIKDLSELQARANELISEMQELTAKTNETATS